MTYLDYLTKLLLCGSGGGGGYPEPTGDISITSNGSHNVKDYATATVNVPTGGDNPFVPAASEGYTEYKNACTSPWQAVSDGGDFRSSNAYINVTKGLGQEIQVGDKVLFTGTVENELTYAVWGQVSRIITTVTQYDRIVLGTGHRASFRPYTTKSKEIWGSGEYNAFGLTSVIFKDTGYSFLVNAEFASEPEAFQSLNVSQFYGAQLDGNVVAQGVYSDRAYIVSGTVTAYDDSAGTGTIDVTDVYPIGTPSLTTKTITENGKYIAAIDDNADGYSEVVVNVPTGGGAEEELAKAANHKLTELNNSLITTVPYYFFSYNTQLTAVNLPNCTTIEQSGFSNCTNLATVNIPKCRTLKSSAFSGCYALTELNLPEVTELGTACPTGEKSTLDRLIAPKLPAISYSSLNNLPKLRLVEIQGNNGIGGSNLSGCSLLQVLAIRTTARVCTNQSAGNLTLTQLTTKGKVLVPRALLADYQSHNNWTPCASRFFALEDYTVDGTTTGALDETKIWS